LLLKALKFFDHVIGVLGNDLVVYDLYLTVGYLVHEVHEFGVLEFGIVDLCDAVCQLLDVLWEALNGHSSLELIHHPLCSLH
jgi:hypothetical protein